MTLYFFGYFCYNEGRKDIRKRRQRIEISYKGISGNASAR